MICKICNREFSSNRGLSYHITHTHNYTSYKDYYDNYVKSENDGICKICGKVTTFDVRLHKYKECCSSKCTCLLKYGVEHNSQIPEVKERMHTTDSIEKMKQTNLLRYGVESQFKRNDIKEKAKIGSHTNEVNSRRKQTCLNKYGVESLLSIDDIHKKGVIASKSKETKDKIKETCYKKYGVSCPVPRKHVKLLMNNTDVKQKRHDTRLANGWINNSYEKYLMNELNNLNVSFYHNYKSNLYPYKCDFYIPEKDLYIEINGFWTHQSHFYNSNDENDLKIKVDWETRSKNNEFFKKALYIWTINDIDKLNYAKNNNLNYVILWNKEHINRFIDLLSKGYLFKNIVDFNNTLI